MLENIFYAQGTVREKSYTILFPEENIAKMIPEVHISFAIGERNLIAKLKNKEICAVLDEGDKVSLTYTIKEGYYKILNLKKD